MSYVLPTSNIVDSGILQNIKNEQEKYKMYITPRYSIEY